jgi:hypothetical protein
MTISVSELNMSMDDTNLNGNDNATPSPPSKKHKMYTHNTDERRGRSTKTVVILGAAYGGARAARMLAQTLPAGWRLVVIDRNSHMNRGSTSTKIKGGAEIDRCLCLSSIFDIARPCPQGFYPIYENARSRRSTS